MAVLPLLLSSLSACAPDDGDETELPVVALGRYIEIATARDEPVCGGTAAYMDRVLEAAFDVMGETPPDHQFVRFEWLELDEESPVIGGGQTSSNDEGVLIRSDVHLVEEHELVHAVQRHAWPRTNDFLLEGHAVLLDPKRIWRDAYGWPSSASLDELIAKADITTADYPLAWYIVSQIVFEHGFDGLRDFWHAVPRGSTAAEVRSAYEALFDRSMDLLLEPYVIELPIGPSERMRRSCDFALCPAPELTPWQGDVWTAVGPVGCEDDPSAVGPDQRLSDWGDVWRDYTFTGEPAYYTFDYPAKTSVSRIGCALECEHQSTGIGSAADGPPVYNDPKFRDWESPVRVEVRAALSQLPVDAPGTVTITRSFDPPE